MTSEERMQVLKMIETGKISAEDGLKLLESLDSADGVDSEPSAGKPSPKKRKSVRIEVFEGDLNKPKVNVNIPFALAKIAHKIIPSATKFEMNGQSCDLDDIFDMVKEGTEGTILEVDEPGKKERVIISVC